MKLKCIKNYAVHWAILFTEGEWYEVSDIANMDNNLIINPSEYSKMATILDKISQFLLKGYKEEDLENLMPEYNIDDVRKYLSINYNNDELYLNRIKLQFYCIEDNLGIINYFCSKTKQDLIEQYNSCTFTTTVQFSDEFFLTQNQVREFNINLIL